MRDREIVAAVVAGDPAGLAAAFDAYAPALHGLLPVAAGGAC
jgi:hypothetical protein